MTFPSWKNSSMSAVCPLQRNGAVVVYVHRARNPVEHLALVRAGSLTVAIGTEGRAPALGRRLREEMARVLGESGAADEVERLATLRAATPSAERREALSRAVVDVHFTGSLRFRKD